LKSTETYDLIIIGAGPIGLACAIEATRHQLKYVVLEKGVLVNSLFHFPTNMTFFSTSNLLEIGDVPFISHSDKPTRREALEYYRRVWQSWKLRIKLYEEVLAVTPENGGYEVLTAKQRYHTRFIIVATGFYGKFVPLNVPGEDLPKVRHYYDEAHPYIGQKVVVVGAANSACDVALETYQKGAEVTMVIREDTIYEGVKYWIKPNIENRIKEGSIKAFFNSTIKEIRPESVVIQTPEGEIILENDFILAMTGYQPDYGLLTSLGIQILDDEFKTPVHHSETLETNLAGVYLAGVLCGGLKTNKLFIENSRIHAEMIVGDILRNIRKSR
jgi:thioredoxin reductase (NADPH)